MDTYVERMSHVLAGCADPCIVISKQEVSCLMVTLQRYTQMRGLGPEGKVTHVGILQAWTVFAFNSQCACKQPPGDSVHVSTSSWTQLRGSKARQGMQRRNANQWAGHDLMLIFG